MNRWFRHYAGMMRDDKLVSAAIKAKQPVERAVWIWGAILESAAELNDDGRYELDAAEAAYFLRTDQSDVDALLAALEGGGRIAGGRVVKWGERQFQSDRSAERQKRHRDRKKTAGDVEGGRDEPSVGRNGDANVTSLSRHGDAPEAETDTEAETERNKEGGRATRATPEDASRKRKGTRIPSDFQPDLGEALILGLGMPKAITEAANFKDYWAAKPGAAGVKLDWEATWRVWCRRAAGDTTTGPSPPTSQAVPMVWITEDDPRFKPLQTRFQEANGRVIAAHGSRHEPGIGHHFPAEWAST